MKKWSQATSRPAWFPRDTSALGIPRYPASTGSCASHPYPQVPRVALRLWPAQFPASICSAAWDRLEPTHVRIVGQDCPDQRSEERRVGKECRL